MLRSFGLSAVGTDNTHRIRKVNTSRIIYFATSVVAEVTEGEMRSSIMLAAALLSACVTTKTAMLDERTAIISGRAHAKSGADVVHKMLVEAALEAQKRGFEYFKIVETQDTTRSGSIYMPGNTSSTTTGQASCYGYSCYGSATTNTSGYGPHYVPYVQAGADITVRFLHAGDFQEGESGVWSVSSVLAAQ